MVNKKLKVVVAGLGYVGFPLVCAIEKSKKYDVYSYDINEDKVNLVNNHIAPIKEERAEKDFKNIIINATTDPEVFKNSSFIVICVPTPVTHDKKPDLTPVIEITNTVSKYLEKGQTIILESTVNPGVSEEIILPILEKTGLKGGIDFDLVHCPERIDPGNKKFNVHNIPRNIGGTSMEGTKKAADFYRSFLNAQINEMSNLKVVESTKIVENIFRDVNIAFVNELAKSFDKLGIDVVEVINGASNKPFSFLAHYPGCGVGGHCIAVDPYYLIDYAHKNGFEHDFLKKAREINNSMPRYTVEKLIKALSEANKNIKNSKIGILGLSYKGNIGDLRESPAIEIREILNEMGVEIYVSEPYCNKNSKEFKEYNLNTTEEVLEKSDAVIIASNHDEFRDIKDWKNVKIIIDGRNFLDKSQINPEKIVYRGIGRGN